MFKIRLWHEELITKLPRQQLLGQWRETSALLGNGWGRKHRIVDYVFKYDKNRLANYAYLIAIEMERRGYKANLDILDGKYVYGISDTPIYPEHNQSYLKECIDNLAGKGIILFYKEET